MTEETIQVKISDHYYKKDDIDDSLEQKASISHSHGNITNEGVITNQVNKNVVTDGNGKITTEAKPTIPVANATATNIKMDGTQSAGSLASFARADHVHPTDTSRAEASHNHDGTYIKTGTGTVTSANIADKTIVNGDIADGTIESGKIKDGTIVNGDIASNASIAFSKLNISKNDIVGLGIPSSDNNTTYSADESTLTKSSANVFSLKDSSNYVKKSSTSGYLKNDGTVGTPTNTTYNVATTSSNGLMSSTDKTNLDKTVDRYDGNFIGGIATVTKPYLRLFHIASRNDSSSSSHLIFEIIGNNNDRLYTKIRVDMRQNSVGENGNASSYTVTPLEVYGFDLNQLYFGFYDNHVNSQTCLDIYRKVGAYVNFYIRIADDHLRDGSYTMFKPVPNGTESYTDLNEASTSLYNANYTSTSQGGTYTEVTNAIPYTNVYANKFVKRNGTSSQFLKADGSVDSNSYLTTSNASSTYLSQTDVETVSLTITYTDDSTQTLDFVVKK